MAKTKHTKSKSLKRVKVKLPGGRVTIHLRKKKPKKAHCANCKKLLHGVPRGIANKIRKLSKSKRSPNRPYAGMLCSSCTRKKIIENTKDLLKEKK